MLTIFYRRFYILLFLIWLVAMSGLFVLSVWGTFDSFVSELGLITHVGSGNATNASTPTELIARKAAQAIEGAGKSVRREVVHEVRSVEKRVENFFVNNSTVVKEDPIAREIEQDLAANRTQPASGSKGKADLEMLNFTHTPEQFLARLGTTEKVGRVTYFHMSDPGRLVVDLRGKWTYSTRRVTDFLEGFVKRVVLGKHADRLRLVFFFADPKVSKGKKPELVRTPAGLDIVIESPAE